MHFSKLCYNCFVKSVKEYLTGVRTELSKVEWPSLKDVVKFTVIVLVITTIVGAYVGGLDLAFTKLLELVLQNG